jgi:hypothetical protein
MPNLTEFQKHLIRQHLGEGIIIRAIANELNVSKNTVLLAKEMFVSMTRDIFVLCHHTIVNLFVSKPELNGERTLYMYLILKTTQMGIFDINRRVLK